MLNDNWKRSVYDNHNLEGTRCSIQNYLAEVESKCPPCACPEETCVGSPLMISGVASHVFDGPSGPEAFNVVEVYARSDIPDLQGFVLRFTRSGEHSDEATKGKEVPLDGCLAAGQYLRVAIWGTLGTTATSLGFGRFFLEAAADYEQPFAEVDHGKEYVELRYQGDVADAYGQREGEGWWYGSGWAYRAPGTGPSPTYSPAGWAQDSLVGLTQNQGKKAFPTRTFQTANCGFLKLTLDFRDAPVEQCPEGWWCDTAAVRSGGLELADDPGHGSARSAAFRLPAGIDHVTVEQAGGADAPSGLSVRRASDDFELCRADDGQTEWNSDQFRQIHCKGLEGAAGTRVYLVAKDVSGDSQWGRVWIREIQLRDEQEQPLALPGGNGAGPLPGGACDRAGQHYQPPTCAEMVDQGKSIVCSTQGDPHVTMFSGFQSHPQGAGEYVLATCASQDFTVHACHRPLWWLDGISVNHGFAIKWGSTVVKVRPEGVDVQPPGAAVVVEGHKIRFPMADGTEAVVIARPDRLTVKLPAACCGNVNGLCGQYSPAESFADAYTDAAGQRGSYPSSRWGGPYGGEFQRQFVDSFKVAATAKGALFTAAECPGDDGPVDVDPEPSEPFEACEPGLLAEALTQCPRGRFFDNCLNDVGATCDLSRWVKEANDAADDLAALEDETVEVPAKPEPRSSPSSEVQHGSCDSLVQSGKSIACSTQGDPHVTMFAGYSSHPMGSGEHVLARCTGDTHTFAVHSCHQPVRFSRGISVNRGFAIQAGAAVIKILDDGIHVDPPNAEEIDFIDGHKIVFKTGEVLIGTADRLTVKLPATCCGNVEGLCGRYTPAEHFKDAYTTAAGVAGWYTNTRWGGPYGGQFQMEFVESFKTAEGTSLFTADECPTGGPNKVPLEPPGLFEMCPEDVLVQAKARCPKGRFYENCLTDVGVTCDVDKWVGAAEKANDDWLEVKDNVKVPRKPEKRYTPEPQCMADLAQQPTFDCPNIGFLLRTSACFIECGQPVCPGLDDDAIRAACTVAQETE